MRSWESTLKASTKGAAMIAVTLLIFQTILTWKIGNIDFTIVRTILHYFLVTLFSMNLVITFFHLRFINKMERNRNSSFGGLIGLFGLFIAIIPGILDLLPELNIHPIYMISDYLFGCGLVLCIFGFLIELTRIDEPLIYWFKIHFALIVRIIIFVFSLIPIFIAISLNLLTNSIFLAIILFLVGYISGSAVWIGHRYFKGITSTESILLLLWSIILIIQYPFEFESIESWLPPILLLSVFCYLVLIWRKEIYLAIVSIIRGIHRLVESIVKSIVFKIQNVLLLLNIHKFLIFRYIIFAIGVLMIVIDSIYWYQIIDNLNTFLFLTGYTIAIVAWYNHSNVKRYGTVLSSILIILGLIGLSPFTIAFSNPSFEFSVVYLVVGFSVNLYLWKLELKNALIGIFSAIGIIIKSALESIYISLILFINKLVKILKQVFNFIEYNYQEIIRYTISTIGLILFLVGILTIKEPLNISFPVIISLSGFFLAIFAWYHHKHMKLVGTILATILGVISFISYLKYSLINPNPLDSSRMISGTFLVIALLVNINLWHKELIKILYLLKNIIIEFIKEAAKLISHIISLTVNKLYIFILYLVDHWWDIIRGLLTFSSIIIFLYAPLVYLELFSGNYYPFLEFLRILGVIPLVIAWYTQIHDFLIAFGHRLKITYLRTLELFNQIIKSLTAYFKHLIQYILDHQRNIARGGLTFIGVFLFFTGTFLIRLLSRIELGNTFDVVFRFIGIILLYITWNHQINALIGNIIREIINSIAEIIKTISNAINSFIQYLIDHRWGILRGFLTFTGCFALLLGPEVVNFSLSIQLPAPLEITIRIGGLLVLIIAWFTQIIDLIKQIIVALNKLLQNLLELVEKTINQLIKYLKQSLNSVFLILIAIISFLAIGYGFILLTSAFLGDWSRFLLNIDIVGDVLSSIAMWFQPEANSPQNVESLLGFLKDAEPLILIILGIILIGSFGILMLMLYNPKHREPLKLTSLRSRMTKTIPSETNYAEKNKGETYE